MAIPPNGVAMFYFGLILRVFDQTEDLAGLLPKNKWFAGALRCVEYNFILMEFLLSQKKRN